MVVHKARSPVKATQNTFRILRKLQELNGAGVTELADSLDLSKASAHSYLSTLLEEQYVVKHDNVYYVGLRFMEFGAHARHRTAVYSAGKPEVQSLAQQTGELVNLLVEEHGKGVYIYRETGPKAVSVDSFTGHRVYLHNTALGKAILSKLPPSRVESILDSYGMPATSPNTITDRERFKEELKTVRSRGFAIDDEERLEGIRCVAAPIVNDNREVEGAISVSGPKSRMKTERFTRTVPELLGNAVNIIELNIAYG